MLNCEISMKTWRVMKIIKIAEMLSIRTVPVSLFITELTLLRPQSWTSSFCMSAQGQRIPRVVKSRQGKKRIKLDGGKKELKGWITIRALTLQGCAIPFNPLLMWSYRSVGKVADVCLGLYMVFICALSSVLVSPHPWIHLSEHRALYKTV